MNRKFCILCGLCLLLCACQKEEVEEIGTDVARQIYLRATVENAVLMSRAPFSLSAPDGNHPLKVEVWASTDPTVFTNGGLDGSGGTVALHTSATFSNGEEQLLNDAVYPKENTVYFVGLHPEGGWNTPEDAATTGKTATRSFNGSEDVMFAPPISGRYAENVDTWPTFRFHHLLTWLRVKVKAESEAVSEAWGNLQRLQLKSDAGNSVTIDLKAGEGYDDNAPTFDPARVTFSSTDSDTFLDLYATGTDRVFQEGNYPLPYKEIFEEVAYVLCAPVAVPRKDEDGEDIPEYTLIVTTDLRSVEVPVDLKVDDGLSSTMNHQFVLNLTFRMGNDISLTASLTDWKAGGISNGVFTPTDESLSSLTYKRANGNK